MVSSERRSTWIAVRSTTGTGAPEKRNVPPGSMPNVLPSSSREVLGAGPDKQALHEAALRAAETFSSLG